MNLLSIIQLRGSLAGLERRAHHLGRNPSPILEERTCKIEFREYVHCLLETVGNQPVILGVVDMVLGNNLLEL